MKKLLIIDTLVVSSSPSMKAIVGVFDVLEDLFDEIELWTVKTDVQLGGKVKLRKAIKCKYWSIQTKLFRYQVKKWVKAEKQWPPADTLVFSTGSHPHYAHVRYMQFSQTMYELERKKRPQYLKFSLRQKLNMFFALKKEREVWEEYQTKEWWVVSRHLGRKIQERDRSNGELRILPNSYDEAVYNPETKEKYRNEMRKHYEFSENEIIFAFSSLGHFERKGLKQAIEAINICRQKGMPFRFIIFGGNTRALDMMKEWMLKSNISDEGFIFTGLVDNMHKHLSCADAFLFPSHFEAFSLSEIEACALGLNVYLTPHYGAEMLLDHEDTGSLISWNPTEIADTLIKDYKIGKLLKNPTNVGEALSKSEYKLKVKELFTNIQ